MYKYSSVVSIEDTVEACEAVAFQIVFKENIILNEVRLWHIVN